MIPDFVPKGAQLVIEHSTSIEKDILTVPSYFSANTCTSVRGRHYR